MANWWDTPSDESAVAESAPTLLDTATLERQARQAQLAELLRPTPTSAEPSILSTLDSYRQAKAAAANPPPVTVAPAVQSQPDKPFFDLGNTAGALWEGATEQLWPAIKATAAQAYTGLDRPDQAPEWAKQALAENRQVQEQKQAKTAQLQREGKSDSVSESIREAIPSLPFSVGSLAAGLAAAAPVVAMGGGLTTPAGIAAGMAGSAAAAYRLAGSQYLSDAFAELEKSSQEQRGRGLDDGEKQKAYEVLRPLAEKAGYWEAGPEAIGNAATMGLGRIALGFVGKEAMQKIAGNALQRAGVRVAAGLGNVATELGTETVTQVGQGVPQGQANAMVTAMREGKPLDEALAAAQSAKPEYEGVEGVVQAFKDVAPATLATLGLMGAGAKAAHWAYQPIAERAEAHATGESAAQRLDQLSLAGLSDTDLDTAIQQTQQVIATPKLPPALRDRLTEAMGRLNTDQQARANGDALRQAFSEYAAATAPEALADLPETEQLKKQQDALVRTLFAPRTRNTLVGMSAPDKLHQLNDAEMAQAGQVAVDAATLLARANQPELEPEIRSLLDAARTYSGELRQRRSAADVAGEVTGLDGADRARALLDSVTQINGNPKQFISPEYRRATLADDQLPRLMERGQTLLRLDADPAVPFNLAAPQRAALTTALGHLRAEQAHRQTEGWQDRNQQLLALEDPKVKEVEAALTRKDVSTWLNAKSRGPQWLPALQGALDQVDARIAYRQQVGATEADDYQRLVANRALLRQKIETLTAQAEQARKKAFDEDWRFAPGQASAKEVPDDQGRMWVRDALGQWVPSGEQIIDSGIAPPPATAPTLTAPATRPALSAPTEPRRLAGPPPAPPDYVPSTAPPKSAVPENYNPLAPRSAPQGQLGAMALGAEDAQALTALRSIPEPQRTAAQNLRLFRRERMIAGVLGTPAAVAPQPQPIAPPVTGETPADLPARAANLGVVPPALTGAQGPLALPQPGVTPDAETVRQDQGLPGPGRQEGQPAVRPGAVPSSGNLRLEGSNAQGAQPAGQGTEGEVAPNQNQWRVAIQQAATEWDRMDRGQRSYLMRDTEFAKALFGPKNRPLSTMDWNEIPPNAQRAIGTQFLPTPSTPPENRDAQERQAEAEALLKQEAPPASTGAVNDIPTSSAKKNPYIGVVNEGNWQKLLEEAKNSKNSTALGKLGAAILKSGDKVKPEIGLRGTWHQEASKAVIDASKKSIQKAATAAEALLNQETPPPEAGGGAPVEKQAWEMTRLEYKRSVGYQGERQGTAGRVYKGKWSHQKDRNTEKLHERLVADALKEGKPVPQAVLDEYPDLAPKPETPDLTAPFEAMIDERGNVTRGGDVINTLLKPLSDADLTTIKEWARKRSPQAARWIGDNAVAEQRARINAAQTDQVPATQSPGETAPTADETALQVGQVYRNFDLLFAEENQARHVARAEIVKIENGQVVISASIKGVKGKREIPINAVVFAGLVARLQQRDAQQVKPIPDQTPKFDATENAELMPFKATYPLYNELTIIPANPIHIGFDKDQRVVAYHYFRLWRKVPKSEQKRFEIYPIVDEHYRIAILQYPDGETGSVIEYPYDYKQGVDANGKPAVQFWFKRLPQDTDAIKELRPVWNAARDLWEQVQKIYEKLPKPKNPTPLIASLTEDQILNSKRIQRGNSSYVRFVDDQGREIALAQRIGYDFAGKWHGEWRIRFTDGNGNETGILSTGKSATYEMDLGLTGNDINQFWVAYAWKQLQAESTTETPPATPETPNEPENANREPPAEPGRAGELRPGQGAGRGLAPSAPRSPRRTVEALADAGRIVTIDEDAGLIEAVEEQVDPEDPSLIFTRLSVNRDRAQQLLAERDAALGLRFPGLEPGRLAEDLQIVPTYREAADPQRAADTETDDTADGNWRVSLAGEPERVHSVLIRAVRVDDIESQDQTLYAPAGPVYLGRGKNERDLESLVLYRVGEDATLYDFLDAIEQANARLVVRASAERNQATLDRYFTTADTRAPVWVAKDADGVVVDWSISQEGLQRRQSDTGATLERMTKQDWQSRQQDTPIFEDIAQALERFNRQEVDAGLVTAIKAELALWQKSSAEIPEYMPGGRYHVGVQKGLVELEKRLAEAEDTLAEITLQTPLVAPSGYQFKVEKKEGGRWYKFFSRASNAHSWQSMGMSISTQTPKKALGYLQGIIQLHHQVAVVAPAPTAEPAPAEPVQVDKTLDAAALSKLIRNAGMQPTSVAKEAYADDGRLVVIRYDAQLAPETVSAHIQRIHTLVQEIAPRFDANAIVLRRNQSLVFIVAGHRGISPKSDLTVGIKRPEYFAQQPAATPPAEPVATNSLTKQDWLKARTQALKQAGLTMITWSDGKLTHVPVVKRDAPEAGEYWAVEPITQVEINAVQKNNNTTGLLYRVISGKDSGNKANPEGTVRAYGRELWKVLQKLRAPAVETAPTPAPLTEAQQQQITEVEELLFDQLLSQAPMREMLANDTNQLWLQVDRTRKEIGALLAQWTAKQFDENPNADIGPIANRIDDDWRNNDYAEAQTRRLIERAKAMQAEEQSKATPQPPAPTQIVPPAGWRNHLIKTRQYAKELIAKNYLDGFAANKVWDKLTLLSPLVESAETTALRALQPAIGTQALVNELARQVVDGTMPISKLNVILRPFDDSAAGMIGTALRQAGATPEQIKQFGYEGVGETPTPAPAPTSKTIETPIGPAKARPAGPGVTAIELPVGAAAPAPATARPESYGKANTIFTEDAAAKARELLKRKLGQLNAGLDPEIIQAGITLAGYHIEAGARAFADYAQAMINDLGEAARPFLRSWYEGARHYPGFDKAGLTGSNDLDQAEKWGIWPGDIFKIKGQNKTVAWINEHFVGFADSTQFPVINLASTKRDWELVTRVGAMPQEAASPAEVDALERTLAESPPKSEQKAPVAESPVTSPAPTEMTETPTPAFTSGARALAESVKTFLLNNPDPLRANQLWAMADTAFGGTQAEGRYNSKDAYDAMELGLNQAVLDSTDAPLRGTTPEQMQEALAYLERLQQRLPTQTRRDAEQQQMQQFSTPHVHSHVVAWVAHIQPTDVVLEPTAGTGNLVTHAKLANPAAIFANELSERRDALLRQIPGVQVFNENANHLHAILPARIQPTVVVMNPPFSADVNLPGQKKLDVGALHIEQALQRLQPGGRLVAIVGRGMAMDAPRFSDWWKKIEKQYNVRANIAISGREYTKFGTSFDNRILVIDKNGQTGIRSKIIGGEVERVADLIPLLKGVRDERTLPTQSTSVVATGQTGVAGPERETGTGPAVSPATGGVRGRPARPVPNAQGRPGRPEGGAGAADERAPGESVAAADNQPGQRGRAATPGTGPESAGPGIVVGGDLENQTASTSYSTQPLAPLEFEAREQGAVPPLDSQSIGVSRFESYQPQTLIKGAQPHPTQLVESAAMASVSFPPLTYLPTLPSALVTSGRLSAAQLETISYAGQAHAQLLPNSERRGFYIGDGTGVGKGAQVAGILLDNWNQGRKKAVWVSENVRLLDDARRDAEWVGLGQDRVVKHNDLKGTITLPEGVIFTTYDTLSSGEKETKGQPGLQRIDQLVNWLGADFEGVIAFDEAHNMANLKPQQGPLGQAPGSKRARFGVELQRRLPKARIVYVSATGATEIANLAYAERLGLWGEGTAFSDRDTFLSAIENGGLAAMEVVAKDLKAMGLYTARSLSYDGVDVEMLNHPLTPEQVTMYDTLATTWQGVLSNVEHAMVAANSKQNADARKRALSAFWGAHQRFFNSVLTSLSVPSLLKDVEAELQAHHSIVMQLVNTNEATQERRMAQAAEAGQELEDIDLSPRDVLMQYVQNSFPTTLYEEYLDDEGNRQTRPVFDSAGNAVQDPLAVAMRDDLLIRLATLSVPEGVLEQVINHFGSDAVAEITMRKRRLVRQKDGSVVEEKLSAAKRKLDAQAFDDGKKRILIFSYAGGTGRSYHADLRYLNQQRRVHYLVQPGWRADKAIQGLGRTHRTNQAHPPLVKPITTELKAQRRFISSIARRMDQMGAITRGQRDANTQGLFDEDANLENQYSQAALFNLFLDIAHGQESTITIAEVEKQMGITLLDRDGNLVLKKIPTIQQFLNRLLSLEIPMMDRVFDAFDRRRRNLIEYAKQAGTYDTGMETLVADSLIKLDDQLAVDHAFGTPTRYLKLEATHPNRIITFKELQSNGAPLLYARNRKSGRLYAFLEAGVTRTDTNTGAQIPQVIRQSPIDRRYFDRREITGENYEEIKFATPAEARAAWEQAMAEAPQFYKETLHLLTGALLPIWDRLPQDTTRVIRAQTDTGERLLGRVLPNKDVNETLRRLGVGVTAPKLTGQQALDALLNEGATLVLANNWRVTSRTVNGQSRIEVLPTVGTKTLSDADRNLLESMGGFSEMIAWNYRIFLPTDQPAVLERLIASKPIIEVLEPGQTPSAPARPAAPAAATPAPTTPPQRFAIATPTAQDARDAEYLAAVERGDLETAQRMVLEAAEASGLPIIDEQDVTAYRVRRTAPPKKTVKAYKLFRLSRKQPGEVFALFVGATDPLPQDVWLDAIAGPRTADSKTGKAKVKSKLGPLAFRPGWHAGDVPLATHIGAEDANKKVFARKDDEVWAEVEVADDVDYQPEADANGTRPDGKFVVGEADIKRMPENGMYRYKTNPNMTGKWIISGAMKINRILSENEVNQILRNAELPSMPWATQDKKSKQWIETPLDLARWGLSTNPAINQKKLLDPVTYDDAGNVIPLSQRFDRTQQDIRFAQGATPASVRASLEAIAGDRIVQDLIDAGSLVLVATQQDAVRRSQGRIQIPPGQRVGGAVDPETGTVYLIAEHIRPADVAGLLRHEVAVHQRRLGLDQPKPRALQLAMALLRLTPARQWMGETTFAGVLDQMERMRKAGNVRVVAAFEHALKAMKALNQDVNNPQLVAEEALAYLVGDQANADLPLFRRILAAVRTFLTRAGFKLELTTDDLVLLAQSALETAAQREVRAGAITRGVLGRNEEDAEAARQYAEVVARYTNPDGSKKDGWMKAPNGQPTKLNERQWVQTRTENFKRWFGDFINDPANASKVVDANGEPLVVWHGTPNKFTVFDADRQGERDRGDYGKGFYFGSEALGEMYRAHNPGQRGRGTNMPVFLALKNPWDMRAKLTPATARAIVEHTNRTRQEKGRPPLAEVDRRVAELLKDYNEATDTWTRSGLKVRYGILSDYIDNAGLDRLGYDGITDGNEQAAFKPTQAKSALGNTGAFSPVNPDIRYAAALGLTEPTLTADELLAKVQAGELDTLTPEQWMQVQRAFLGQAASVATGPEAPTFKTWFGQSKIKSKTGQPVVMYHGTPEAFTVFDAARSGANTTHPTAALGFFFTNDQGHAAAKYGANVMAVYLAIEKPYAMTDADLRRIESLDDAKVFRARLEAQGYDGIVMPAETGTRYVAAFRPDQIKFTNNETYTRGKGDMRFAIAPGTPPQMTPPPMTRIEVLRRAIQDRFLRFKTVQNWLKQLGINLTPDADVYGEEERSVKRFAAQAQDFRDQTLTPLVQAAGQAGYAVTGGDFIAALMDGQPLPASFKPSIPEYLIAQHAAERNRAIAKINPRYADPDQPGSGLTDAEAATILARYRALPHFAAFERMAEQFRAIAEGTKNLLLDAGILNAETVAAWDAAYQHYVPLKGGPDDAPAKQGTGPGNSVVARQRRAMGHDLRAEHVLENIFRDRERALFNIEKNKVGQALIKLVQQANNPAIGTVGQPEKHATLIQGWLHEVWIEGRPLGAYQSYNDAKAAIAADSAATGRPVAQYGVRHKAVDPSVVYMTRPLLSENEAGVYINGELVRIQLNDEAAARAYNALGVDGAGGLLKVARSFNTFLSKAYTGYNPEFLLVNMARDLTAGTINLTGKYGAGFAAQALKHYVGSFREAWRFARDKGTHTWLDRYRQAGGSTGASYLSDLERLGGDIERTFEDAQGAVATWKAGKPGAAARVLSADVVRKVFGLIEAFNQAGENALRIATFRTVIEQGGSDAEAASAAANVTVNFNRRGEMTYPLGALYLFFNPNVQGTQVLLDTLLNSPHKRQAQAAAAGMVALAFLLANLARGGDDEDEERWRRIPGYTKDRNLILQLGEKQITVPLPYGYGMFWALGNVLSDLAHGADDGKAGVRLASALFEHFSPLGNPLLGETAGIKNLAELMPTLLRMPTDIMINRGGLGSPIMPEVMPWNPGQPDSARRWRETTGGLMDRVTTGVNKLAGGSAYESSGALTDISPETLRYLWRGLTGGAGQFLSDTLGWGLTMAQGVVPELRETPGLRKFVRVETVQNARTLFSDQANQIREAVGAFNAAKRAQDSAGMFDLVREKAALIRLGSVLEQFQGLIKTRRQLHDLIQASDMPLPQKRLQLKTIEQEESKLYGLFSQIFRHSLH